MDAPLLIVGGGIAGIVAALRARQDGRAVILVERQQELGGLLTSFRPAGSGCWFDHGTHIPAETGDTELDRVLFGWLDESEWRALPVLKAGTFWNGRLNPFSPWIDLRSLPESQYRDVLAELLRCADFADTEAVTLGDQLRQRFGPAMVDRVFDPTLVKYYGLQADALAPDAHLLFGLMRFVCLDAEKTRELKREPALDAKIGFHSYHEMPASARPQRAFYPRNHGVGQWISGLERALRTSGVEICTGCQLRSLDEARRIAEFSDGRRVRYSELVWTLPAGVLLRLIGHEAARALPVPRLSSSTLYHFVADDRPETDAYYITCHDPALKSFRVTLYGNLQSGSTGQQRITVEVLTPIPGTPSPTPTEVFDEVKRVALLPEAAQYSANYVQELGGAFPIQTPEYRRATQTAAAIVERECESVRLIGRAAGQNFFMKDVLLDVWRSKPEPTWAASGFAHAEKVGVAL